MSHNLTSTNAIVVGASQGLGHAIAEQLAVAGAQVTAVARNRPSLDELAQRHDNVSVAVGDATDPTFSARTMSRVEPNCLVLVAGAIPVMRPISQYDWESYARPFHTDTKLTFHWLRDALHLPMPSGARIVVFSSGAAIMGSPLSGGYAAAKQAQRFLASYVRQEVQERQLDWKVQVVLPQLNPNTELGAAGVRGYAKKAGLTPEEFVKRFEHPLTPEVAGRELAKLLSGEHDSDEEMMLTGQGLGPLPA